MAKVKKTPQTERETYKYYGRDGKVVSDLIPREYGVTDLYIYQFHKFDDREVYQMMKAFQGIRK